MVRDMKTWKVTVEKQIGMNKKLKQRRKKYGTLSEKLEGND